MLVHLAWHAVHAAAPVDGKEAASHILRGRARRSPWHAPYARRPPPQAAGAPRPKRPAMRRARRRRPERPRGLAVQPNKDPSPRDWPPWPPCGPRWERAPHTPWPHHTQETWLLQRTQRQCRCGTADSRRTSWNLRNGLVPPDRSLRDTLWRPRGPAACTDKEHLITGMLPREGGFDIMLQETGIVTRAHEMHVAAALRDKGYTPFFSSQLAETGATSTSRGGGLLTAVSSKYVAEHEVLSSPRILWGPIIPKPATVRNTTFFVKLYHKEHIFRS